MPSPEQTPAERGSPWGDLWVGGAVMAAGVLAFGLVVLPLEALVTIDGYYHIKLARLMIEEGLFTSLRWLPFTVLGDAGPDHHWLWHVLLMPFAATENLFVGLKWGAVITAAGVMTTVWFVAHRLKVPWAPLFAALAVTGATIMPGRIVQLRAQNLAIICVLLACWALARRRHLALGLVAFAFMLGYHGAVILAPLVMFQMALVARRERRIATRPLAAVVGGALAGLVCSPWFPENVEYLFFHTFFKVMNPQQLAVGGEWQPVPLTHILVEAWPALAVLVMASAAWAWARRTQRAAPLGEDTWLLLLATAMALLMYRGAWRFAEYFVPLAAVASGLLVRDSGIRLARRASVRWALPALVCVAACVGGWNGLTTIERQAEFVPEKYATLADALERHAEPGDVVFNRVWEDFVFLFWHRPDLRYVNGLDPHYLAYGDRERYELWWWVHEVTRDEPNDPAPLIRKRFDARWVVVNRPRGGELALRLKASPHARLVEASRWGWLFHIELPEEAGERPRPPALTPTSPEI